MMATARMPQPTADDPVKGDPKHYKVEFENDRVRVQRIKYGAGEKSVMHSHPESIAVFLTDAHGKFTYPDGKTENINAKAGTVQHMDAHTRTMHLLACKGTNLLANFFEPRLAQSHTTVVIPLYKRVVFVRLLNCTEFSSRLSEISQTLDAITGKLVMENDVEK
jgi:quercetin dioxygenase-like cupin family protein